MATIHQSDLSAWSRCAAQVGYKRAGLPTKTNSAAAFGSVIHHCFGGEVEYLTPHGPKTFAATVGTTQQVLTRGPGCAVWVDAAILDAGVQRLFEITLRRGRSTKTIRATAEHRWFVCTRSDRASETRTVTTQDLAANDLLAWQFPRSAIGRTAPMATAVGAGIVFGDGTKEIHQSRVDLWGDKADLQDFFALPNVVDLEPTAGGVKGISIRNLPLAFKDRPELSAGVPYLFGWLAGWIATDGCVRESDGAVSLSCSNRDDLEFARQVATRLGFATNAIVMRKAGTNAYSDRPSYNLTFVRSTLPDTLFVRASQRHSFDQGSRQYRGWRVERVIDTGLDEPVFCADVPDSHAFVLEDWIYTGNSILQVLERQLHDGVPFEQALTASIQTFLHYWHPGHIEAICTPVPGDGWLPRMGYSELRARGPEVIRQYADLIRYDDVELLATEFEFVVPIDGTWDDDLGEPHRLAGAIDRLVVRHYLRQPTVGVDDLKTGKDYEGSLRHNVQFSAYCYATTRPEFWTGWQGNDGFGEERGAQLYDRFRNSGRRGTWINLKTFKYQDAGWRGPIDYSRFALAVEQMVASIKADIFPLSISGSVCKYCDFRDICGGTGLAGEEHGKPARTSKAAKKAAA